MKKKIHPENYRPVVFQDMGTKDMWLSQSTVKTEKTITWEDGNEYPLYALEISSFSHPHYTGKQRFVDSEGRIDKFNKRYKRK